MEREEGFKKTGSTPTPEGDGAIAAGNVLGVLEVKSIIVKYRDGYGRTTAKFAFVIPGGEIYFLDDEAARMKPAQSWMKNGILKALAGKTVAEPISMAVEQL